MNYWNCTVPCCTYIAVVLLAEDLDGLAIIVGGRDAKLGEVPFIAALSTVYSESRLFICGGSLIGPDLVLTAAHCFDHSAFGVEPTLAIVGSIKSKEPGNTGQNIKVLSKAVHAGYVKGNAPNDIALVRLEKSFEPSRYITTIDYATSTATEYERCYIAGWGSYDQSREYAKTLQMAETKLADDSVCVETFGAAFDGHTMICAYAPDNDACAGDSGGPLYCSKESGALELVGIVSWGGKYCVPGKPGVYTRVTTFSDWIAEGSGRHGSASTSDGDDVHSEL